MESIWDLDVFSRCFAKAIITTLLLLAQPISMAQEVSLFSLPGKWNDQNGKEISFDDFKGKVTVLSMVYTSCDYSCPLITNKLKLIHSKVDKSALQHLRFVLVTFDPDRDTVKKLKEYSMSQKLDESSFSLLTSTKENAHTLGMALGFQYKKTENGDYSHSNLITVLNKNGVIIHQQEVGSKIDKLLAVVHKHVSK